MRKSQYVTAKKPHPVLYKIASCLMEGALANIHQPTNQPKYIY